MFKVIDEHRRDALGAELTMRVGARAVRRDVRAAYSYLASNDPRVHVGLGKETVVRDVVVRWPTGQREQFGDVAADKIVVLAAARVGRSDHRSLQNLSGLTQGGPSNHSPAPQIATPPYGRAAVAGCAGGRITPTPCSIAIRVPNACDRRCSRSRMLFATSAVARLGTPRSAPRAV